MSPRLSGARLEFQVIRVAPLLSEATFGEQQMGRAKKKRALAREGGGDKSGRCKRVHLRRIWGGAPSPPSCASLVVQGEVGLCGPDIRRAGGWP